MLEETLRLDSKGIIPCGDETEKNYIKRGWNLLSAAARVSSYTLDKIESSTHIKPREQIGFPAEVSESMLEVFGLDPSWLPVYRTGTTFSFSGDSSFVYSENPEVPVIFYSSFFRTIPYATILHEAVHAVRSRFVHLPGVKNFEEAMADYGDLGIFRGKFRKSLVVRSVKKKLEELFGPKAGRIMIRLLPPEIYLLDSSEHPAKNLKEWSTLRHKIIKERLGI